jgi:hypothetical protein
VRPYPEEIQRAVQLVMMSHFAPELTTAYSQRELGVVMLLFQIIQRDYDTAVPDLIEQNTKLRSLLGETANALAAVDRDDARAGRASIAGLPPPTDSLRLSVLRQENDALRAMVAALAPIIEPAADDGSLAPLRPVRLKIYEHLRDDAKRRAVPMLGG